MRRRHELTDAQWERIEELLPGKAGDPGRTAAEDCPEAAVGLVHPPIIAEPRVQQLTVRTRPGDSWR